MKLLPFLVLLAMGCLPASTLAGVPPGLDPISEPKTDRISNSVKSTAVSPLRPPLIMPVPPVAAGGAGQKGGPGKVLQDVTAKAMAGDSNAQNVLGSLYADGTLVKQDMGIAFLWWLKAAQGGHTDAQSSVASCYFKGNGVTQNLAEGVRWTSKVAEAGRPRAMYEVAMCYLNGIGVAKDVKRMVAWFEKSANAGVVEAQSLLGALYFDGQSGVGMDREAACKWFTMAADQDDAFSLDALGTCYIRGEGVAFNGVQGVRLWRRAAERGFAGAQFNLATAYIMGRYVVRDYSEAYVWMKLAALQGQKSAVEFLPDMVLPHLTKKQIALAMVEVKRFTPRPSKPDASFASPSAPKREHGIATGTGFFITKDGYLVTNHHVVDGATAIHVTIGSDNEMPAKVVVLDKKSDLAILKVTGVHPCLAIAPVRGVKLGATVATVGFPNISVQGFSPKLAKGEIASLAGIQDDPGEFQISVPLQPGNSGGSLVDAHGNVVGVVCAIMNQKVAIATTGTLANSVAYAVKSSLLMNLVESVPGLADKLADPATQLRPFEDIVAEMEHATVLIVVNK